MIIKGKKGDERVLGIWMFLVWTVIALVIVLSVFLFYGQEVDIKLLQSDVLGDRIADCLFDEENVKEINNFYEECKINQNFFDENKLYAKISFFELGSEVLVQDPIRLGNEDIETQCDLRETQDEKKSPNLARCYSKLFYGIKNGQSIRVEITTGSNNYGGRV